MKKIKEMPDFERPREKLTAKGPEALSDIELIAVILGSGIKDKNVFQVAKAIHKQLDQNQELPQVARLKEIEGVGSAKACQIVAAFELARRRLVKEGRIQIRDARDVLPLINHIIEKKQEYFICLSLNGANEVIGNRVVTVGLLNSNQVHPREVFGDVISDRAAAVILAHNHPSGQLQASADDLTTTRQMIEAGRILGIAVLDHIIITRQGYLSLKEKGLM
jgi:DNA repair protein RadC